MNEGRNTPGLWNPWRRRRGYPVASFEGRMDDLFESLFSGFATPALRGNGGADFNPRVDVTENEKELIVSAELPGVDEKDVDVSLHEGILRIRGEKKSEQEKREGETRYRESSYGSFERAFTLPCEVNEDNIDASFSKGVLTLRLPKQLGEKAKAKKISIRSS